MGASDIHILTGKYVTYRVNGILINEHNDIGVEKYFVEKDDTKNIINNIFSQEIINQFYREKELDIAYQDKEYRRYRLNVHYEMGNIGLSIRILKENIPTLDQLKLPGAVKDLLKNKNGLILVTGPTGSGKTTTLAAMIEELNNTENMNIITIEDPVEYLFQSKRSLIRQRELGRDTKSFAHGLKSVLRQDPDVILVGEMRDLESIEMAITVAETGHLVFGTLHTNGAPESIDRIIDVFPKEKQNQIRTQLSSILRGIINQQLVPGTDNKLVAACEILINTPAVSNYILSGKTNQILSVIESGQRSGMVSMKRSLEYLLRDKKISDEEYKKRIVNK